MEDLNRRAFRACDIFWLSGISPGACAKKLAHAASGFGAAFSPYATAHLRKYVASRSVWEDPQRIVAALAVHAQIKDTRQCNRQRRFTLATDRWMQSDSASYSRIDTPARLQAKNYRAARKENLRTEK
ncbi:hypothetical protein [Arcanobacterium hippocoleae]|uniref:hypothetical protein n=1 Tax=Arcanobacterium hippocoleae TaxID=149017 RepID=UPI0033425342